jgi:hypothetical protein
LVGAMTIGIVLVASCAALAGFVSASSLLGSE